jgi:hypothetical protein
MIASSLLPGQLGAGSRQPCPADGHQQGNPAAAQQQQQRGQSRLAGMVGQESHRHQLV